MVCQHLAVLERELLARGVKETHRGQAWIRKCCEWVHFHCRLDLAALRGRLLLPPCVIDQEHRGTHDGSESGSVCTQCWDAILGLHPTSTADAQDHR